MPINLINFKLVELHFEKKKNILYKHCNIPYFFSYSPCGNDESLPYEIQVGELLYLPGKIFENMNKIQGKITQ